MRGFEGGTRLAHAVNHEIGSRFRHGRVSSLGLLIGLILISFPAAAEVYPVSGVWTAADADYPAAANETCIAVKTFGVEAVSRKSVSELIIFANDKRYDVKGDVQTEATIKSIKLADGGFRITETFAKGARWLGFKRKATYLLNVIDPRTIEIWDGMVLTRYAKCGPERPPI
jgi:FlaG/FlaF family flagellin (archaellin)